MLRLLAFAFLVQPIHEQIVVQIHFHSSQRLLLSGHHLNFHVQRATQTELLDLLYLSDEHSHLPIISLFLSIQPALDMLETLFGEQVQRV